MRIAAYGFLLGTGVFTAFPGSLIIQGGALVILGWAVWYLLARAFPAHFKAAREERELFLETLQAEREEFLKVQENTRRNFRESINALASSLDCLTAALVTKSQD